MIRRYTTDDPTFPFVAEIATPGDIPFQFHAARPQLLTPALNAHRKRARESTDAQPTPQPPTTDKP